MVNLNTRVKADKKTGLFLPEKLFKPGEMGLLLEWEMRDKNGKLKEHHIQKGESFVQQFLQLLMVQMLDSPECCPTINITDESDKVWPIAGSYWNFNVTAAANDDSFGLVIGTGQTAPAITDYKLGTKIANGTGAGQLQYGGVTFGLPSSNASVSNFTITRVFSNSSGGIVTPYEVGVYAKGLIPAVWMNNRNGLPDSNPYSNQIFCIIHDVIAAGITMNNGDQLTINYRQVANI